ncbi:MAG TPA: TIGR00730 family Rossman fold protein [Candidatus Baltobacteraceae bacterium]|nr:TIGR00730 family Rossman fold protein [Candidatus Baltobacteraceae bacterium]
MRVCVYCGSSPGDDPRFVAAARAFGAMLAQCGIGIVYGGGRVGLMGALADAALAEGGEVVGIIPQFLEEREVAHVGVDLRVVSSMHERKALMAELSDAFVALPGGFGTLEEFFEIVTWVQLGLTHAPCILADVEGFYAPLVAAIDRALESGFVSARNRAIVEVYGSLEQVVERLQSRAPGEGAQRA